MGCDRGMLVQSGRSKSKKRRGRVGGMEGEGEKGLLWSGVENCGTCLNVVSEVIGGYCGTWLEG